MVTDVRMRLESTLGPWSQRGPRAWSPKSETGTHRDERLSSVPVIYLGHQSDAH